MKINMANRITILRIIIVPIFMAVLLSDMPNSKIIAAAIFIIAALSDKVDGYIARKYNQITTFGKIFDPLADKLLVCSAFVIFIDLGIMPAWMVFVIIAREFIVASLRTVAADGGKIIAASIWGKLKTVVQFTGIIVFLLGVTPWEWVNPVINWAILITTLVSGIDYIIKNMDAFKLDNM